MANKELMITLGLESTTFAQGIKRAKELNKELDSSFKLLSSSSEKFENTLSGLGKKQEYLAQKMQLANTASELYAKRIKETQEAILDAQAETAMYGTKLEQLRAKLEATESTLGKNSSAYKALAKELKETVQLYGKAEKDLQTHNRRMTDAKTGYNEVQTSMQGFNRELELTSQKMEALKGDSSINKLKKNIDDLDHSFELVKNSTANFDKSMEGLSATQDHLTAKQSKSNELLSMYSKEMDSSNSILDLYRKELDNCGKELDEWNGILKEMKGNEPDYDQVRQEVEGLRQEYTQINQIVKYHEDRVESLGQEYKSAESNIAKLTGSMQNNANKMQAMKNALDFTPISAEIKKLTNGTITKLESELKSLDNQFKLLTTYASNYENSITGLTAKQTHFSKSLEVSNQAFEEYSKELSQIKGKVNSLTTEQRELEKEIQRQVDACKLLTGKEFDEQAKSISKLKQRYEEVNKSLATHKTRLGEVEAGFTRSRQDIATFTAELGRANQQLDSFGRKKVFDGLQNEIKSTSEAMRLLDSSFKVTESSVKSFGSTKKDLAQQTDYYRQKLELLRTQQTNYRASLQNTETEMERLKAEQQELVQSCENLRRSLASMDSSSPRFNDTVTALSRMEAELNDVEAELRQTATQMNTYQTELNQTTAQTNTLARQTQMLNATFSAKTFATLSSSFKSAGSVMTNLGNSMSMLRMATVGVSGAIIKTGSDFSTAMSGVYAVTQATGEEMKALEAKAIELGEKTTFTSTEVADGLKYLGMAGYDTSLALKTIPEILSLAQAGSMDLAEASDLATDALSSLGYVGEDVPKNMSKFLNQVAEASVKSNTSITQMLQAYIKVGGGLENMNVKMETSGAMLGVLATRGYKAEQAGNSLNSILINMTKQTGQSAEAMEFLSERIGMGKNMMFDAEGNIRDLEECMVDLHRSLKGLTEQERLNLLQKLGGKTQFGTLTKLMNGMIDDTGNLSEEYVNLKKELEGAVDTSALETLANTMTDNVEGDFKRAISALQTACITLFKEFEPQIRKFLVSLTEFVKGLNENLKKLSPAQKEMILKFTAFTVIAPTVLKLFGGITSNVGILFGAVSKLIPALAGTATTAITAGAGLAGVGAGAGGLASAISLGTVAIGALVVALTGAVVAIGQNESALAWLQERWGVFGTVVGGICETLSGTVTIHFRTMWTVVATLGKMLGALFTGNWRDLDDIAKQGVAEMQVIYKEGFSDMAMESTRALSKIRTASQTELESVATIYRDTLVALPKVTKDNLDEVSTVLAGKFKDMSNDSLLMARGTSDTLAVLLDGISEGMDVSKIEETLKSNMNTLLQAGKLDPTELQQEFDKAIDIITANATGSYDRCKNEVETITKELSRVATNGMDGVARSVGSLVSSMDTDTITTLSSIDTKWANLFKGLEDTSGMSSKEIADTVLNNLNEMGANTPETLNTLVSDLNTGFETAKTTASTGAEGITQAVDTQFSEVGTEIEEKMAETNSNVVEETSTLGGRFSEALAPVKESISGFGSWVGGIGSNIGTWAGGVGETVGTWASDTATSIGTWSSETYGSITTWASDTGAGIKEGFNGFLEWTTTTVPETVAGCWETVKTKTSEFITGIPSFLEGLLASIIATIVAIPLRVGQAVAEMFGGVFETIKGIGTTAWGILTLDLETMKTGIMTAFGGIGTFIGSIFTGIWDIVTGTIQNIALVFGIDLDGMFTKCSEWITNTYNSFTEWGLSMITGFPEWLGSVATSIGTWVSDTYSSFTGWVSSTVSSIGGWVDSVDTAFNTWVINTYNAIAGWVSGTIGSIGTWISTTYTNFITWKDNVGKTIDQWKADMWKKLTEMFVKWLADTIKNLKQWKTNFDEGVKGIKEAIKGLPEYLLTIGKDMIAKLWDGFSSGLASFKQKVTDRITNIFKKAKEDGEAELDAHMIVENDNSAEPIQPMALASAFKRIALPATNVTMDNTAPMALGSGGIFSGMFDSLVNTFTMDNYKTNGGYYSSDSVKKTPTQSSSSNGDLINALVQQNQILMQLLTAERPIEVGVNMDGRQVAKASARYMENELSILNKRKSRLGGTF